MAIVVKWAEDGHYLQDVRRGDLVIPAIVEWSRRQRKARRFESRRAFTDWAVENGVRRGPLEAGWWASLRFVRLVPRKRNASLQP